MIYPAVVQDQILALLAVEPLETRRLRDEILGPYQDAKAKRRMKATLERLRIAGKIWSLRGKWALSYFKSCASCAGSGWRKVEVIEVDRVRVVPPALDPKCPSCRGRGWTKRPNGGGASRL